MRFIQNRAMPSEDLLLEQLIDSGAQRLFDKLMAIDVSTLQISDYNKRYLGTYMVNLTGSLQRYASILQHSLYNIRKPTSQIVFIDYGGGSGLLSLLAKEIGIGTVIYVDIYEQSCIDARIVAETLGIPADYYVTGDIDDLLEFLKQNDLQVDAIASYDVIEHIYDIESFFQKLTLIPATSLVIFMVSSANGFNPYIKRQLTEIHHKSEFVNRQEVYGHKKRDSLRAFAEIRRDIIVEYAKKNGMVLTNEVIDALVKGTRGMVKTDIEIAVNNYLSSGYLPKPSHPTNTCDPYTGNWAERLLNPFQASDILERSGFTVKVVAGYYSSTTGVKNIVFNLLNRIIAHGGRLSFIVAPSYGIYACRSRDGMVSENN